MSTIKSSTLKSNNENMTINADGASSEVKFQANGVEKASISSAGAFTSTTIDATALTGNLPAIDGSSLTGLDTALAYNQGGTGATNRTVENKLQESVSVKDFGVTGDGTTDDTTTIQAALDYVLSSGKSLYFPAGVYKTGQLTLQPSSGKNYPKIYGENPGRSLELSTTGSTSNMKGISVLWFQNTSGVSLDIGNDSTEVFAPTIENLAFVGTSNQKLASPTTSNTGIRMRKCRNARFENVTIHGFHTGLYNHDGWVHSFDHVHISYCHRGMYFGDASNKMTLLDPQVPHCQYGIFIGGGADHTLISPWCEQNVHGIIIGGDDASYNVKSVSILDGHYENISSEAIIMGRKDSNHAETNAGAAVSIADSDNTVEHITIQSGHWDSIGADVSTRKLWVSGQVSDICSLIGDFGSFDYNQIGGTGIDYLNFAATNLNLVGSKIPAASARISANGPARDVYLFHKTGLSEGSATWNDVFQINVSNGDNIAIIVVDYMIVTNLVRKMRQGQIIIEVGRYPGQNTANAIQTVRAANDLTIYSSLTWYTNNFQTTALTGGTGSTQTFNLQCQADNNQSQSYNIMARAEVINGHKNASLPRFITLSEV